MTEKYSIIGGTLQHRTTKKEKFSQLFHKKQPTAAHCGQSRALLRSPLPASLHYAATSGHHVSTPCHGEALAKTDPLASRLQNPTLPRTLSRRSLVRRRMHPPTGNRQFRAQLLRAGKSAKITFSKIKFLSLECRENTRFLKNYGISVKLI